MNESIFENYVCMYVCTVCTAEIFVCIWNGTSLACSSAIIRSASALTLPDALWTGNISMLMLGYSSVHTYIHTYIYTYIHRVWDLVWFMELACSWATNAFIVSNSAMSFLSWAEADIIVCMWEWVNVLLLIRQRFTYIVHNN